MYMPLKLTLGAIYIWCLQNFQDFWPPPPCQHLGPICSTKITQPPLLSQILGNPLPPPLFLRHLWAIAFQNVTVRVLLLRIDAHLQRHWYNFLFSGLRMGPMESNGTLQQSMRWGNSYCYTGCGHSSTEWRNPLFWRFYHQKPIMQYIWLPRSVWMKEKWRDKSTRTCSENGIIILFVFSGL